MVKACAIVSLFPSKTRFEMLWFPLVPSDECATIIDACWAVNDDDVMTVEVPSPTIFTHMGR